MRRVLNIIEDYLGSERDQVRRNVCIALGALGTPEAIDRLVEIGRSDQNLEVRRTAARELASAPEVTLSEVVQRLHKGLASRSDRLRNFELLQAIADSSERPIAQWIGPWAGRIGDTLRLTWRLRTTRESEFFLLGLWSVLPFLGALILSFFALLGWFTSLDAEDSSAFRAALGALILLAPLLWLALAASAPPELSYLAEEAPFADALALFLYSMIAFVPVLVMLDWLGVVTIEVASGQVNYGLIAVSVLLFVVFPLVAARMGVAVGTVKAGRLIYLTTAFVSGLGCTILAILGAVLVAHTLSVKDAPNIASFASTTAIGGLVAALLLSFFFGFAGLATDGRPGREARQNVRIFGSGLLFLIVLAFLAMVTVEPFWRSRVANFDATAEMKGEGSDVFSSASMRLLDKPIRNEFKILPNSPVFLEVSRNGTVTVELQGLEDVVLVLRDGASGNEIIRVDTGFEIEMADQVLEPGSYIATGWYYAPRAISPQPDELLWLIADRAHTWLGGNPEPWPWPKTTPLTLSVNWLPTSN